MLTTSQITGSVYKMRWRIVFRFQLSGVSFLASAILQGRGRRQFSAERKDFSTAHGQSLPSPSCSAQNDNSDVTSICYPPTPFAASTSPSSLFTLSILTL